MLLGMKIVPTSAQNRIKADIFEIVTLLTMPFSGFLFHILNIYIYAYVIRNIHNIFII